MPSLVDESSDEEYARHGEIRNDGALSDCSRADLQDMEQCMRAHFEEGVGTISSDAESAEGRIEDSNTAAQCALCLKPK